VHDTQLRTTPPGFPGGLFHRGKTRRRAIHSYDDQLAHRASITRFSSKLHPGDALMPSGQAAWVGGEFQHPSTSARSADRLREECCGRLVLGPVPPQRQFHGLRRRRAYRRDQDVFDPGITIEDSLALIVDYASGASMAYPLNAHSPWEGYVIGVNGTKGRAELTVVERGSVTTDTDGHVIIDPSAHPELVTDDRERPVGERIVVQRHFEKAREVPIPQAEGGHGGGDAVPLRDLFAGADEDPLGHAASWHDGVRSLVVGLVGNRSDHGPRSGTNGQAHKPARSAGQRNGP
jgi:hypothetical protein